MNTYDLPAFMRDLADNFAETLRLDGARALPPPALPAHTATLNWRNWLFTSSHFRRAHVELFEIPAHFAVVHVCILPHGGDRAPIFGFDMIAGRAQATGIFLDFSPVTSLVPVPALGNVVCSAARAAFSEPRVKPNWGDVFSPDFFAIRPAGPAEITQAIKLADAALVHYLPCLSGGMVADPDVIAGQVAYARAQRQNPHTVRMLTRYVGVEAARAFVDEVLFPFPEPYANGERSLIRAVDGLAKVPS